MPFRQRERGIAHHSTQEIACIAGAPTGQCFFKHLCMPLAGHAVGQHTRPGQAGTEMLQTEREGAKRARHGRGVDHRQHRQTKTLCEIGGAGFPIEQPHHAFDDDQVRLAGRFMQPGPRIVLARHPQIDVVRGPTCGERQPVRIQEIGPALEGPHAPTGARMQARQGRGHGGLALTGGRGSHENGRARLCHFFGAQLSVTYAARPGWL